MTNLIRLYYNTFESENLTIPQHSYSAKIIGKKGRICLRNLEIYPNRQKLVDLIIESLYYFA